MRVLFNRYVSVAFGRPGEEGILVDKLRINFDVEKMSESFANVAKVQIFNMSKTSRELLAEKDVVAILRAGYLGKPGNIEGTFSNPPLSSEILSIGDVSDVFNMRAGTDRITEFKMGDGQKKLNTKFIEKSFAPGVKIKTIFDDLFKELDIPKGVIRGIVTGKHLQ